MSDTKPQSPVTSQPPAAPPVKRKPNTLLWRLLILPSLLILGISIGAYLLRPARDAFLSGETYNSYTLFSQYSTASPYFWIGGPIAVLFVISFLIALIRTVARGEWGYWQRLLGLLALIASGVLLFITGQPEIGTAARDAGAIGLNGRVYRLLAQTIPAAPGTDLRFLIFECDTVGVTCQRIYRDDKEYGAGDYLPPLAVLKIEVDGVFVVVRGNSPTILTKYRPQ